MADREVDSIDLALAYVWLVAGFLAVLAIILLYVVLTRTPSRRDYLHVFVASLLATRVLFCGVVLLTSAIIILQRHGWHLVPCQVAFWGWTTSWFADCLTVLAALVCGFLHLRKAKRNRRMHTDVMVAVIWVFSTITASCLILARDEEDKLQPGYESHCWILPHADQQVFGFSFILVYLIASIIITVLVSILGVCILPVKHKPETVSSPEGPVMTGYQANGKHVTFNGATNGHVSDVSNGHAIEVSNGHLTNHVTRIGNGTTNNHEISVIEEQPEGPGIVEPVDRQDSTSYGTPPCSSIDALDRVNILCVVSSLCVFLSLIPQSIVLGISMLREVPVMHGQDILLACGLLHALLLPAGLCLASRPYRRVLAGLLMPRQLTAVDQPEVPQEGHINTAFSAVPSSDDYVTLDSIPNRSAGNGDASKQTHQHRRAARSVSSIWSRERDMRRKRIMASVKRSHSNQTTREWLQNLKNSVAETDKIDDFRLHRQHRSFITRRKSSASDISEPSDMIFDDLDIDEVLDTLEEEDEGVIQDLDNVDDLTDLTHDTTAQVYDQNSFTENGHNIYDEVTEITTSYMTDTDYCGLEEIERVVQNRTPFHVSQKYCVEDPDGPRNERLKYIIQGLEDAGVPFVIDHLGMVHVFDNPDNVTAETIETLTSNTTPVMVDASSQQDDELYVDLYARATNPFNSEWQPIYAHPAVPHVEDEDDPEIIAITFKGRKPPTPPPPPPPPPIPPELTQKKKTKNPFLSTSFLQKFTKKNKSPEDVTSPANINDAFLSQNGDASVWNTNTDTTHQLQYQTLGYHGSHVTVNNPFMTSSPVNGEVPSNNPFLDADLPNIIPNNPFLFDSQSNSVTSGSSQSSATRRTSSKKKKLSFFKKRSFSIVEFLRSKSENLAVSDDGQGYTHNNTHPHANNPFVIQNGQPSAHYTTEYV